MTKQHVGAQSDAIVADPALEAARAAQRAAREAIRPRARLGAGSRTYSIGDGDVCPIVPAHGQMFALTASRPPTQYCPNQSHDGVWLGGKQPPTRNQWPLHQFESAVRAYHQPTAGEAAKTLPDLDIDLGGL